MSIIFTVVSILFVGLAYFLSPHEYRWDPGLADLVSADAVLVSDMASVAALVFAAIGAVILIAGRNRRRILIRGPILAVVAALAIGRLIYLAQLPPGT